MSSTFPTSQAPRQAEDGHRIDQIIDCKRSQYKSEYRFKVSMYCECCTGRSYWLSERELRNIGDTSLLEQASQAVEFYGQGVEIRTGCNDDDWQNFDDVEDEGGALGTRPGT